ncbi:MAG TPA: hypothetical protein P5277_05245 [Candidatus Paceibacterota bacterium]|nr:hypothetical protein [Candidatus Paceibacterota bacterium]
MLNKKGKKERILKKVFFIMSLLFGSLFFISLVSADAIPRTKFMYLRENYSTTYGTDEFWGYYAGEFGDYNVFRIVSTLDCFKYHFDLAGNYISDMESYGYSYHTLLNDTLDDYFSYNGAIFTLLTLDNDVNALNFSTGYYDVFIRNLTPIGVGSYPFKISLNMLSWDKAEILDAYNQTVWILDVTPNTEVCQVLFNETSALLEGPIPVTVYTNCSSDVVLAKNGTTIENGSTQLLSAGAYNFSLKRNDTVNYSYIYNESEFRVLPDTTFPTFTTIPSNSSLFYGNESLSSVFLGADNVGFGYYSLNDTRFLVTRYSNGTGVLKNATPLAVGNYELNVSINDTSNNINWTRYKVQINKSSNYDCGIYFNATSPLTYPESFIVYTNCSSNYNIYRNGSSVSNNSAITSGVGYYNLTVQRTDTLNYTNTVNTQFFRVDKNEENCRVLFDTTSPVTYPGTFSVFTNCSTASVLYRDGVEIQNNSEQSLNVGTYNFSFQRTDSSNYSINYNETVFSVVAAEVTASNSVGGGSSSNPNAPKTYTADPTSISSTQGETFELKPLDKVSFKISESTHTATLNVYTSTTARVTIRSTPLVVVLEKGILSEFDLDSDLINDLAMRYDGIIDGKVSLFMKEILPLSENLTSDDLDSGQSPQQENSTENPLEEDEKSKFNLLGFQKVTLIVSIAFLIIIGSAIFYFIRRKKRNY